MTKEQTHAEDWGQYPITFMHIGIPYFLNKTSWEGSVFKHLQQRTNHLT